jgi:hypothetical protein
MFQGILRRIHVFLDRCAEVYLIRIKFITIHEALHLQRDNAQLRVASSSACETFRFKLLLSQYIQFNFRRVSIATANTTISYVMPKFNNKAPPRFIHLHVHEKHLNITAS